MYRKFRAIFKENIDIALWVNDLGYESYSYNFNILFNFSNP